MITLYLRGLQVKHKLGTVSDAGVAAIEAIRDDETLTALIGALVRATDESAIRTALAAARNGELYDD